MAGWSRVAGKLRSYPIGRIWTSLPRWRSEIRARCSAQLEGLTLVRLGDAVRRPYPYPYT